MNTGTRHRVDVPRRAALRRLAAGVLAGATSSLATAEAGTAGTVGMAARIVTVGGALTEVIYLLGAEAQLVGTDTTSLYPPDALKTPKVGYMRQLSAEGLLSLRPDAVVATTESGPPVVLDQLRGAGVRVELVEADHTWDEIRRKVRAVGRVASRETQARALQDRLDAEWAAVQGKVAAAAGRRPRVLFVLSHSASPQVAGAATAAHAVIGMAGGVNCMEGFRGYRPMTAEAMARAAPDVILTTTQSLEAHGDAERFWQRPELALTPAFARRALVAQDALLLLGFGPRLPGAIDALHARLRT